MREFKFRMFIKETGMVYRGIYDQNWYFHPEESKLYREIKQRDHVFPLMQYTGLQDKNKKDVYEGDIIKTAYSGIYQVKFGEYDNGFKYEDNMRGFGIHLERISGPFDRIEEYSDSQEGEIIGNIYENPDLLTKPPEGE